MHLLPAERSGHRIIDGERVCEAIAAITCPSAAIQARAQAFAVLGDPTVSQTLRYLRAAQVVSAERDGQVIRYQLADGPVVALLAQ